MRLFGKKIWAISNYIFFSSGGFFSKYDQLGTSGDEFATHKMHQP